MVLASVASLAVGCATAGDASTGGAAGPGGARNAPDDRDLVGVVPAGPETVLEIDLGQLRDSPWSRGLLQARSEDERQARRLALGYDELVDVDRMVFAVTEDAGGPLVLTISQGRFTADAVGRGFAGAHPGATADPWRGSPLWRAGQEATALVTPRTLVSGRLDSVRGAIDCAFGLAPDARGGGLGPVRRAMEPERGGPALVAAVAVTEAMRQRVGGEFQLPDGLHHAGARLDLGAALDVSLLALHDRPEQAAAAARLAQQFLVDLRGRTLLRVFGLGPLLDGASFHAEGTRLRGQLHIPESERADLAQKITLILETLRRARSR
ncbi:MAG: hypothetical protein QOI66_5354 [Myxococcales bacterium]|jgi:hypothetical protein|nr:hypothetical protein [Myxococcales bacterium]